MGGLVHVVIIAYNRNTKGHFDRRDHLRGAFHGPGGPAVTERAACVDAVFVMLQRYNRPRILQLLEHRTKSNFRGC